MKNQKYILGVDGGATNTTGCVFTDRGDTKSIINTNGTNLNLYKSDSISRITNLIIDLCNSVKIDTSEVSAFGFGLSGVSDFNQREMFLKELDKLRITSNCLILSDAEAAFHLLCPTGVGMMVSIGTGIICLGRNSKNKTYVVAGNGHDKDLGSSYWIGKKAIENILINEAMIEIDFDLNQLYKIILDNFSVKNLNELAVFFENSSDIVCKTAYLAKNIVSLAENDNEYALSIIQEATRYVSDYIIMLVDELKCYDKDIVISANGSLLKNAFYRKLINESLEFDFKNIHWIFSDISPAYGAGMMAAAYKNINVPINKIVERIKN